MGDMITVFGVGAMGTALIRGLLSRRVAEPQEIIANDVDSERVDAIVSDLGIVSGSGGREGLSGARVVVLAVKPQSFATLAALLRDALTPEQLVISIMAGVNLSTLAGALGTGRVVRAMPNTPAQVGRGVSVWMAGGSVADNDRRLVRQILGALGIEIEVRGEGLIDAATAVHGSGPAYIFLVAEAWIDAAVSVGLDRDVAVMLVRETLAGSAVLWEGSEQSLEDLRRAVTSPGGTTAAALDVFEKQRLRIIFRDAIHAAYRRAQELG